MARNGHHNGHSAHHASGIKFHGLTGYYFPKQEQDPIIDEVGSILDNAGISNTDAAKGSGVSYTTLHSWFVKRKTKRPQFATTAAVLATAGYEFAIVPVNRKGDAKGRVHARAPKIIKTDVTAKARNLGG
jgi:hypothetical protein